MRKFKRVAISGNRDGYFAVVEHDDGDHWYGPFPSRDWATTRGREIEEHGPNAPSREIKRMIFTGA